MEHTLRITYGTSRGRDTYGYTIVSLHEHGQKRISCNGGGYDMRGTVFGDWLARTYQDKLLALAISDKFTARYTKAEGYKSDNSNHSKLYGGTFYPEGSSSDKKPHVSLDGACGWESMVRVAEAIGLKVKRIDATKDCDVVLVSELEPIEVHVDGGVADSDDPRVVIIDHDNLDAEEVQS